MLVIENLLRSYSDMTISYYSLFNTCLLVLVSNVYYGISYDSINLSFLSNTKYTFLVLTSNVIGIYSVSYRSALNTLITSAFSLYNSIALLSLSNNSIL